MASYREMDAVGRDRARFVSLAKHCLAFPDINEWERKFLDSLIRGNEMMVGPPEQLSLRQAERLLSIRDEYELHSELHGGLILIARSKARDLGPLSKGSMPAFGPAPGGRVGLGRAAAQPYGVSVQ